MPNTHTAKCKPRREKKNSIEKGMKDKNWQITSKKYMWQSTFENTLSPSHCRRESENHGRLIFYP